MSDQPHFDQPQVPERPGSVVELQKRRDALAQQDKTLDEKIYNALEHGYEGYKLDSGHDGKPFYGANSHREFEKDRARLQRLRDELGEVKDQLRDEQAQAQGSAERAMQVMRRVYDEEVKHVPKALIPELQRFFRDGLRTIDWTVPQLRTDANKEGMVRMVFSYAAHEARKARAANNNRGDEGRQDEPIDGEHEEAGTREQAPEANEFGHAKGSVAHDISERYKRLRGGNSGILGEVKK